MVEILSSVFRSFRAGRLVRTLMRGTLAAAVAALALTVAFAGHGETGQAHPHQPAHLAADLGWDGATGATPAPGSGI